MKHFIFLWRLIAVVVIPGVLQGQSFLSGSVLPGSQRSLVYADTLTNEFKVGLEASCFLQPEKFTAIDYTGVSNFTYTRKLQWGAGFNFSCCRRKLWEYSVAIGLKDAGWNRRNETTSIEPGIEGYSYTFLYAFARVSVHRKFLSSTRNSLWFVSAVEPQISVLNREKVNYSNGTTAVSSDPRIKPERFTTIFGIGVKLETRIATNSSLGLQYVLGIGAPSYHREILSAPAFIHSLSVIFKLPLK